MDALMANAMFTALEDLGTMLAFVFTARSATAGDGDGDGLFGVQGHPGGLNERARCCTIRCFGSRGAGDMQHDCNEGDAEIYGCNVKWLRQQSTGRCGITPDGIWRFERAERAGRLRRKRMNQSSISNQATTVKARSEGLSAGRWN